MIEDRGRASRRSVLVGEIEQAETLEAVHGILLDVQSAFGFASYTIFNIPSEDECSLAACAFLTSTPHDFFERYDAISGLPRNPVLARRLGNSCQLPCHHKPTLACFTASCLVVLKRWRATVRYKPTLSMSS